MRRIRGAITMERKYRQLLRMVARLEREASLTDRDIENIRAARSAIANYEALPEHLR